MYEDLATIKLFDTEATINKIEAKDPLAKVLVNQELEDDLTVEKNVY